MNDMRKVGGYAALLLGVQFAAILLIQFLVLAPLGDTGPNTPADKLLAIAANSPTPYQILNLITVLFGITVILSALAVRERLQAGAPNRMRIAVIATSIASALFIANGVTSFGGFPPIAAAKDLAAFGILNAVTNGLLFAGIFAAGWFLILWGWAGLSTKGLPAVLNYILLLAGVVGLLGFAIPILGLLGLVINVVWAFWLGAVLLAQPAKIAAQPKGKK